MPKVWCAEITCKHNKKNLCKAREINLSVGNINTLHNGRMNAWKCRTFEESESFKEIAEAVKQMMEVSDNG